MSQKDSKKPVSLLPDSNMPDSIIDKVYNDNTSLIKYLADKNEISLFQIANDSFRKTLVLSAGSLFENLICDAMLNYCSRKAGADACIVALVRIKAIKRQYFTYFEWENRRAGPFFSLLGEDIGERLKAESKLEPLKSSIDAFLELGFIRNCLAHQNFSAYPLEKTHDEVYALYRQASGFVDRVLQVLS
jgi:hypothetical protein